MKTYQQSHVLRGLRVVTVNLNPGQHEIKYIHQVYSVYYEANTQKRNKHSVNNTCYRGT